LWVWWRYRENGRARSSDGDGDPALAPVPVLATALALALVPVLVLVLVLAALELGPELVLAADDEAAGEDGVKNKDPDANRPLPMVLPGCDECVAWAGKACSGAGAGWECVERLSERGR
jgi:hypothetical protein